MAKWHIGWRSISHPAVNSWVLISILLSKVRLKDLSLGIYNVPWLNLFSLSKFLNPMIFNCSSNFCEVLRYQNAFSLLLYSISTYWTRFNLLKSSSYSYSRLFLGICFRIYSPFLKDYNLLLDQSLLSEQILKPPWYVPVPLPFEKI